MQTKERVERKNIHFTERDVNSRPMFTTHDRVGVYHWCECGGLSETTWGGFAG
jgi:hypothetical protein